MQYFARFRQTEEMSGVERSVEAAKRKVLALRDAVVG